MSRIEKVQQKLVERGLDALLVTNLYNLRYVAGFTGTTGLAVITKDNAFFVTDARYTEQAAKQCKGYTIVQNLGPIFLEVKKIVTNEHIKTLGFEDGSMSVKEYDGLKELLSAQLVSASGLVEGLRILKDAEEFDIIRQACHIADQAFDYILGEIKPGVTEIEIANKMDFYMRSLGASGVSFETIIASGERSAMPHGVASTKVIEKGDFITMDYGCYYNGYVSDMTRTISLGEPRHAQLKEIHQVVLGAQTLVNESVKAGLSCADMDKIARDYITQNGYGEYFVHSTGHGIGLEIHEAPAVSRISESVLEVGHAVTNEPGIYIPGIGGVRIEDDIFITENGAEIVTKANRELIIL
ncbi:M24 family metallopeptidase [Granulicatella sp. zg-ZJ]|uniref:M24 family metallopeptidase n=1 Tax=unclassified Granulicatella TaxID=2630493 RepID=UPI0013BFD68B|nr:MULTISPECIES: Xaa-Pro peptidase family protein [unclassified Granulicatella]NEW63033.1 M24 family metallopeptidase [Granulicatella sp. zg-ZJ]NEW66214.1 M24 family metallopeptidase [Granulicatella sp. zg-84]QMI85944.1 aminopeptidase P family protein [Carnobacteriaceae bacterium zg-84]